MFLFFRIYVNVLAPAVLTTLCPLHHLPIHPHIPFLQCPHTDTIILINNINNNIYWGEQIHKVNLKRRMCFPYLIYYVFSGNDRILFLFCVYFVVCVFCVFLQHLPEMCIYFSSKVFLPYLFIFKLPKKHVLLVVLFQCLMLL